MLVNQVKKKDTASIPEASECVLCEHPSSPGENTILYDNLFPAHLYILIICVCSPKDTVASIYK